MSDVVVGTFDPADGQEVGRVFADFLVRCERILKEVVNRPDDIAAFEEMAHRVAPDVESQYEFVHEEPFICVLEFLGYEPSDPAVNLLSEKFRTYSRDAGW